MSTNLLLQAVAGGVLVGGLYSLLALGLSLSWGLLRLVNLSHFALAFLSAYLAYHFATVLGGSIWIAAAIIIPLFFLLGMAVHVMFVRFKVSEFSSMLVTFGLTVLIESMIQLIWSADFRQYETEYSRQSFNWLGIYIPKYQLWTFLFSTFMAVTAWIGLNKTMLGKALKASAFDPVIAKAFGINSARLSYLLAGICTASAAAAGIFIALTQVLSPAQIEGWIGVVFAVVIIGGLANPLGALAAGVLIGVAEAVAMAMVNPAWSPLVAFSILIVLLVWKPKWM